MTRRKGYGLGRYAEEARRIAEDVARELGDIRLDGPHARAAILDAALRCPLVRTRCQARAVVDGWEGAWAQGGRSVRVYVCRSAGRQLAVIRGVFS